PPDETGALRLLLRETAAAGAVAVFAADQRGAVLAVAPHPDATLLQAVRTAAGRLARLPKGRRALRMPRLAGSSACSGAIRLHGAPSQRGFIGFLHRRGRADALLRVARTNSFGRIAALAQQAAWLVQERNLDRARARQLEAELAALRSAHADT